MEDNKKNEIYKFLKKNNQDIEDKHILEFQIN